MYKAVVKLMYKAIWTGYSNEQNLRDIVLLESIFSLRTLENRHVEQDSRKQKIIEWGVRE